MYIERDVQIISLFSQILLTEIVSSHKVECTEFGSFFERDGVELLPLSCLS